MTGLPWVRLDTNIGSHDKMLALTSERDGHRALLAYILGLCYAGGHGTDGYIPRAALPLVQATERHARMLVDHRLWQYDPGRPGWTIRNYADRQPTADTLAAAADGHRDAGRKGACLRWHGANCECWKEATLPIARPSKAIANSHSP